MNKWLLRNRHISIAVILFLTQTLLAEQTAHTSGTDDYTVSLPQEARFVAADKTNPPHIWCLVENATNKQQTLRLDLLVNRLDDEAKFHSQQIQIAPNEYLRVSLPSTWFDQYGIYRLEFRLVDDEKTSPWGSDTLAVYPLNSKPEAEESVMPIGFATGAPRCTPRLLELAASLGFEYYRFNAVWADVQPQKGIWNWEHLDSYLKLVKSHGLKWHAKTTGCATWAAEHRFDPPPLDAWREWISAIASRYSESIQFWEVWNEPNIDFFRGSVDDYTQVQRVAYDAIKEASPNTTVTSGGYAGINHHKSKAGAFEAAFLEYPRAYDWFAYHMHDTFPQFYSDLHRQLASIQHSIGKTDIPIVFSETGYDTRHGQRFQAETLLKKITYAAAIGAKSYTFYNLMDRAGKDEPNRAGKTFGLITNPTGTDDFASIEDELRPKESFVAIATAIQQLSRLPAIEVWSESDGVFAFLFGRANDYLLITWREDPQIPEAIWMVASEAEKLTRRDLFGNPTEMSLVNSIALVSVGEPQYFHFEGSENPPRLLGPLVTLPQTISPDADGMTTLEMELHNPLDHEVTVTAKVGGKDAKPLPRTSSSKIPAIGTSVLPMHFHVGEGALGEIVNLEAQLNFKDLPWSPRLEIPVIHNVMRVDVKNSIVLNSLNQVINKQDYDPHTLHLLWGSPADLSVRTSIFSNPSTHLIKIYCKVTDNHHYAASNQEALLDGDAFEIGWKGAEGTYGHLAIAGDIGDTPRSEIHLNGELVDNSLIQSIQIKRDESGTTWDITLNTRHMGLSGTDYNNGIRFNFAVHDNDGEGPESWISPTPGLGGNTRFVPDNFHILQIGKQQ